MIADRTTETIAHFIGLFDLSTDQARLRDSYEEFTALRRQAELDKLKSLAVDLKAPHELDPGKFDPLPLRTPEGPLPPKVYGSEMPYGEVSPVYPWLGSGQDAADDFSFILDAEFGGGLLIRYLYRDGLPSETGFTGNYDGAANATDRSTENGGLFAFYGSSSGEFFLPFPGSIVTVTIQTGHLQDADTLLQDEAELLNALYGDGSYGGAGSGVDHLVATAARMQPLGAMLPDPGEAPRLEIAEAFADAMLAVTPQSLLSGLPGDAGGVGIAFLTGASFAASAALADLVLAADAALAAEERNGAMQGAGALSENSMAGELVGLAPDGQVVRITAESAVYHGDDALGLFVDGEAVAEAPDWRELLPDHHKPETAAEDTHDPAAFDDRALPEGTERNPDFEDGYKIVTGGNYLANQTVITSAWLDAPVIAVGGKWIQLGHIGQSIVASDVDTYFSSNGAGPAADPGGVTALQIAEIREESAPSARAPVTHEVAQAGPSLIHIDHIEGDLLVTHHVRQTISVDDRDQFGIEISASSGAYVLGDNMVFNVADILAFGLIYDLILIGGDYIHFNSITQTLILKDDDQVTTIPMPALSVAPPEDSFAAGDGGTSDAGSDAAPDSGGLDPGQKAQVGDEPATEGASDNLLVNEAYLTLTGIDTAEELTDSLAGIVSDIDQEMEAVRAALMEDPALAGLEQARVLKVDGDLIVANVVEQTTVLNDSDDIEILGSAPDELETVTGQNALINSASVLDAGVDSTVMAEDGSYSDLLIHQANFIDEDDLAAEINEIVTEAIAFLMEDDMAGSNGVGDGAADAGQASTIANSDDVMALT